MIAFDPGVFAVETLAVKDLILEAVVVEGDDQDIAVPMQVVGVAGVDNRLNWVDKIAEVADRVDEHSVIDFS